MTEQDLKECIAEVKYSDMPDRSKKMITELLYEKQCQIRKDDSND